MRGLIVSYNLDVCKSHLLPVSWSCIFGGYVFLGVEASANSCQIILLVDYFFRKYFIK